MNVKSLVALPAWPSTCIDVLDVKPLTLMVKVSLLPLLYDAEQPLGGPNLMLVKPGLPLESVQVTG